MIVRQLINRIGFTLNKADVKNAEGAFSLMKVGAKDVIKVIAGITAAGTKLNNEFEKNTSASNFFARNKEDAAALSKALDEIAEKSELTSRREARIAGKTLQSTRATQEQIEKFIPLIEKVSLARLDMDFSDVANTFKDVITGGNVDAMTDIIPGFKDAVELLSKSTFEKPFGEITDFQRADLLLGEIVKKRARLNALIEENKKTQAFQFERVSKQTSDFLLGFGETTAPAVTDAAKALADMLEELNKSESVWESIAGAVNGVAGAIRGVADFFTVGEKRDDVLKKEQGTTTPLRGPNAPIGPSTPSGIPSLKEMKSTAETMESRGGLLGNILHWTGVKEGGFGGQTKEQDQKVTLDGKITVVNETGVELTQMGDDLTRRIFSELSTTFKNITAANGGVVGP